MTRLVLRPATSNDVEAIWEVVAKADDITGMVSLPDSLEETETLCAHSGTTVAALAAGAYGAVEGSQHRVLMVAETTENGVVGLTGFTLKVDVPNLGVRVVTSRDGSGLSMYSVNEPWTRTELNSSYIAAGARGRGYGTVLSRGRLMLLHLLAPQIPPTVASHIRGLFREDGTAPFWDHFGRHLAPLWNHSIEAEEAIFAEPEELERLTGQFVPLNASVLDSLGHVNGDSVPAFRTLVREGLNPTELFDPVDGGPTMRVDLSETHTGKYRQHGRVVIGEGSTDALVCRATIGRFKVTRGNIDVDDDQIVIDQATADALEVSESRVIAACPLEPPT